MGWVLVIRVLHFNCMFAEASAPLHSAAGESMPVTLFFCVSITEARRVSIKSGLNALLKVCVFSANALSLFIKTQAGRQARLV